MLDKDKLRAILLRYFDVPNDTYAYNLTRVKEAFAIGTMHLEDFVEFDEDFIEDMVEYIEAKYDEPNS